MTGTKRTRYSENMNIVFSCINLKPTSIKTTFKKNKNSKENIRDICIFTKKKKLKSVTKLRLKEVQQDCHKFGQVLRWGRNTSSSSDVNIKNSSMWYILLLSAFWNTGTKRQRNFIYHIKYIYQLFKTLSILVKWCV